MKIKERIIAKGIWTSSTALRIGGQADVFGQGLDQVVLRDGRGLPFVPGTALAGAARSWMRKNMAGAEVREGENALIQVLFGDAYQSLIAFEDAGITSAKVITRDGVAINPQTGTAVDSAKYDFEALPAGASFAMEVSLLLYEESPAYNPRRHKLEGVALKPPTDADILAAFRLLLEAFAGGAIRLGAKTTRGLGDGRVLKWSVYRLAMDNRSHLAAWLSQKPESLPAIPLEELSEAAASRLNNSFTINAELSLATSLLVRRQAPDDGVDFIQLTENGKCVLPGTSLAGAFRARVRKIAVTLAAKENGETAVAAVKEMFGFVDEGKEKKARRSRVGVSEANLGGGRERLFVQGRVSIDRFTGAALETALFNEAAFWPAADTTSVTMRFVLDDPKPHESGLLLLAFKDLWLTDLATGGETGSGRGLWAGRKASIGIPGHPPILMCTEDGGVTFSGGDPEVLNQLVAATVAFLRTGREGLREAGAVAPEWQAHPILPGMAPEAGVQPCL